MKIVIEATAYDDVDLVSDFYERQDHCFRGLFRKMEKSSEQKIDPSSFFW
jgi:hypothetical protein